MAWADEMVPLLRGVVGDWTNEYSNSDLEDMLVYAAHLVHKEIDFENTYIITISTSTISPDPTVGDKDEGFINMVVLKAAILVLRSTVKTLASQSFTIKDGPSTVSTNDAYKNMKNFLDDLVREYERRRVHHGSMEGGEAVLSPRMEPTNAPYWV